MKRKRSRGEKKPSAVETSPEALAETWKIVEEELKATGFQVSVRINLKGQRRAFQRAVEYCTRDSKRLLQSCTLRMLSKVNHLPVFCVQLSASLTESIVPFDATSETPLEEQRTEAMVRVQDALLVRLGPEALGLLRAARSARLSAPSTPQTNDTR